MASDVSILKPRGKFACRHNVVCPFAKQGCRVERPVPQGGSAQRRPGRSNTKDAW